MSLRASSALPVNCSGLMYGGVPSTMPCWVSFCSCAWSSALAARGDAEVEDLDEVRLAGALGQNDVLGLEVAVDDALPVRLVERAADLGQDLEHALRLHRPLLQRIRETLPLDKLHRDVERAVVGLTEVEELESCSGARAR